MKNKILIAAGILLALAVNTKLNAQEDVQIGKSLNTITRNSGAMFDYSNPDAINIKVQIWGYVQYPGQYIIPATSKINDLLSLAGGPNSNANVDELKLFRINPDSSQSLLNFDYSDIIWSGDKLRKPIKMPRLRAGDILIVSGSPKWYARDYLGVVLSIVSTLASITTLLVYIYKK